MRVINAELARPWVELIQHFWPSWYLLLHEGQKSRICTTLLLKIVLNYRPITESVLIAFKPEFLLFSWETLMNTAKRLGHYKDTGQFLFVVFSSTLSCCYSCSVWLLFHIIFQIYINQCIMLKVEQKMADNAKGWAKYGGQIEGRANSNLNDPGSS